MADVPKRGSAPLFAAGGPMAAAIALAAAGCGDPAPVPASDVVQVVCVERATGIAVADEQCPAGWEEDSDNNDPFFAYYYPVGHSGHSYGSHVSGGSHLKPKTNGAPITVKAPSGRVYTVRGGPGAPAPGSVKGPIVGNGGPKGGGAPAGGSVGS